MPLVRIDVPATMSAEHRKAAGEVVYAALTGVVKAPKDDNFQVIAAHAPAGLVLDPTYLGIHRSKDAIIIQVTLNEGRTVETKQAFYKAVADGLHDRAGLRREDVFINLVEVKKENWSFGNGIAQYA